MPRHPLSGVLAPLAMFLSKFLRRNREACRRLVAGLLLVVIAVGTTGIPLPTWAAKDISVPFPCMHKACGCRTAADCWNSCCCNTNAQKLAWAQQRGIQPPQHVIAGAKREHQSAVAASRSCCSTSKTQDSCCVASTKSPGQKSCCSDKSTVRPQPMTNWVRLEDARRCHGQIEVWAIFSQALTTFEADEVDVRPHAQDWLTLRSEHAERLASHPGERPPRAIL